MDRGRPRSGGPFRLDAVSREDAFRADAVTMESFPRRNQGIARASPRDRAKQVLVDAATRSAQRGTAAGVAPKSPPMRGRDGAREGEHTERRSLRLHVAHVGGCDEEKASGDGRAQRVGASHTAFSLSRLLRGWRVGPTPSGRTAGIRTSVHGPGGSPADARGCTMQLEKQYARDTMQAHEVAAATELMLVPL